MIKRLFFAIVLFVLITAPLVPPAHAIAQWKVETSQSHGAALDQDDVNLGASWFVGMQDSMWGTTCLIIGVACTGSANPADQLPYLRNSASAKLADAIQSTYTNQPADLGLWIADTGRSLGFLPAQVNAQGIGIGFTGLSPLLPLWKAFRNIAYLLMAIVMIVIGFLVMFRKKIDPKTVVTAQNAIPRVIIALILITFSYAIVGAMIDVMYIVLFFFIALFKSAGLQDPTGATIVNPLFGVKTAQDLYGGGGLYVNMENIEVSVSKLLFGVPASGLLSSAGFDIGLGLTAIIAGIAAAAGGGLPAAGVVVGIGALSMPVIHLIISIAILFLFIRLLAFFLTSYIQIIISLILGPLQFLAEAFPGSEAFSSWFKNLVSNLAVFPVGGAMFMLSALFTQFSNDPQQTIWRPPFTAIGGNNVSIASLLSLGILFAIPTVAGSIKEALKAKPAMSMLDFGGAGGSVMNMLSMGYYFKMLMPKWGPNPPGSDHGGKK